MASYVIELESATTNVANWKRIELDDTDAAYASASGGHKAFDVSGFCEGSFNQYLIGIVLCDYETSSGSSVFGVTKYQTLAVQSEDVPTGIGSKYVFQSFSPGDTYIETLGIGPSIDLRSNPVSTKKRSILVGIVNAFLSPLPITLIITPTKIV